MRGSCSSAGAVAYSGLLSAVQISSPSGGASSVRPFAVMISRRPEVILVAAHREEGNGEVATQGNRAIWGGWQSLPAVKAGRVVSLPGDTILRPGPRVAEGVELLARAIHPTAFTARETP